jgi:TIR domain
VAEVFDVFLSHSHDDAEWVEQLAKSLEDQHSIKPWLDKWMLIPGQSWQPTMARGLASAASCVVCLGASTPDGWFRKEIEKALNRQASDAEFRVVPLLLPTVPDETVEGLKASFQADFLELNTWVDFRSDADESYSLHVLVCAIRGEAPGRWETSQSSLDGDGEEMTQKLRRLRELGDLVDERVVLEMQTKILERFL